MSRAAALCRRISPGYSDFGSDFGRSSDMLVRDDQHVDGRLGRNIAKRSRALAHIVGGRDEAEEGRFVRLGIGQRHLEAAGD